jgi:hypothetical protein
MVRFSGKLTPSESAFDENKLSTRTTLLERQKPFIHHFFSLHKNPFTRNTIPLVGGIPSYYLSDIKPVKT